LTLRQALTARAKVVPALADQMVAALPTSRAADTLKLLVIHRQSLKNFILEN